MMSNRKLRIAAVITACVVFWSLCAFVAAQIKVSALPAATAVTTDDLLLIVDDPLGTAASKKITVANFKTSIFASPTLVTPTLGVASATSLNKITITQPATGATLTIPDGVTLNAGAGGTLGSNAFNSTAFVAQTTTVNGKALSGNITLGLASADYANQGTTTTLLHGNAAGNPSFGAASLTADVSGILPTANGGTGVAFFTAAGPTVARVYTFPDAATTILTTNAAVTVAQGGTGLATLTANNVMLGNGTSTPLFVAPGTSGNVLTSNGTTWTSAAAAGGGLTVGTTAITSGTATRLLYETSGNLVGEISGATSDGTSVTFGSANLLATSPKITTGISDANGNSMLAFTATASAVDGFTFTNAATASPATVTMAATGSDSNINLTLSPKGTGKVLISATSGDRMLYADNGPLQIGTISSDNIRFHRGGTAVFIINNVGLVDANGSTGTPTLLYGGSTGAIYSYTSETTSGFGRSAANTPAIYASGAAIATFPSGGLVLPVAKTLSVASGTNQRAGNATLVGGTVTVNNTTVTANTLVILTRKTSGGTIGTAITYTVSAGTSFTITSDNILDTSTFSYMLIEVP